MRLWVCALGGEFGNLDGAGSVSMLGAVTVGWREAGGQETGPQGARSACRGCRERGQEGTRGGDKKPGTSKEHPRNMLATCLQLWGGSGGATVLAGRCRQEGSGGWTGVPGRSGGGDRVRSGGLPRRRDWARRLTKQGKRPRLRVFGGVSLASVEGPPGGTPEEPEGEDNCASWSAGVGGGTAERKEGATGG